MLVSYRWLQDYVEIPWGPQELADRLTMAGLEVEGIAPVAAGLDRVYVGLVEKATAHPNADSLKICSVDVGAQGKYSIVCGAPNVAEGQKVAVALQGANLPNGLEIKPTTIRDVASEGMICSLAELDLGEDHDGIWILPEDVQLGSPLIELFDLDDVVLDVSIYANRPDCMSMLGIAREVAALTGGKVKFPSTQYEVLPASIESQTSIDVQSPNLCPRYTATLLDGVQMGESPFWMQSRLRAAGMRPINNVVDITNYVMLETGQPLHAFDFETLEEKRLVIRQAKPGETLETLDGQKRELTTEMLIICDAHNPKCIAGVMGGLDSEVTEKTSKILLESANFSPLNIRRTCRSLGLSSESSARFEKGADPHGTVFASNRAAHLLQTYAKAKVYAGHLDVNDIQDELTTIELKLGDIVSLLGVDISGEIVVRILESLEFQMEEITSEKWQVTVPSHRGDVEIAADLIEEVVRIWGLENLPSTLPGNLVGTGGQSERLDVLDKVREILIGAGLQEAMSYSFGRSDNNDRLLRFEQPMIEVQNPISEDLVALRHSLLPGLLTAISLNASRQQKRVALFEVGATYLGKIPVEKQPQEEYKLAIALWGLREEPNWAHGEETFDFYDLKGLMELVMPISTELKWDLGSNPSLHPGRQGEIRYQGEIIACYGELHPAVARNFRITGRSYVAEIELEKIVQLFHATPVFKNLPRYPHMERDLAVIVNQDQQVGKMVAKLESLGGELLKEVTVFDVYEGKPIPEGKKSIAFSFLFQGDRTLKDEEVNEIMAFLLDGLQGDFGAQIR